MYKIEIQEIAEVSSSNSGYFQQTKFWCEFKENHGWSYRKFRISWIHIEADSKGNTQANGSQEVSVLIRTFAKGFFSLAYVPLFPSLPIDGVNSHDQNIEFTNLMGEIGVALKPFLPKNTICIRFDPAVGFDNTEDRDIFVRGTKLVAFADRLKLKKSAVDIQPPDSTQIDLTPAEDEILSKMKSKWRYNVNLSARKGVEIIRVTGENEKLSEYLDIFYDLYKITAERDGIALHAKSYYEDLLRKSAAEIAAGKDVPVISLYLAKHENDFLGAIITLFSKTESIYLYGCSGNVKRNLMPNFLLQWTAMKDAKAYGSQYYDMYGMPPADDENHPMHGLYLFKTGFGGNNIHRIGSFDIPLKFVYRFYDKAERVRAFWHKVILKKIRGR